MSIKTTAIRQRDVISLQNEPPFTYTVASPTTCKTTSLATPIAKDPSATGQKGGIRQAIARKAISFLAQASALLSVLPFTASTSKQPETYLNGQLESLSLKDGSPQLRENMQRSAEIVRQVRTNVPCSPNYPRRTDTFTNTASNGSISLKNGQALLDVVRETPDLPLSQVVEMVEGYGVGNCEEMSSVGLKYARDQFGPEFPIERFAISRGDHIFLVIGRSAMSAESDYKNWGPDAVICDPWTGASFPATDLETHLYNYVSTTNDQTPYTVVSRFNPATQELFVDPVMD